MATPTVRDLKRTLDDIPDDWEITRSAVGDIALIFENTYRGYISLRTGEVDLLDEDERLPVSVGREA